MINTVNIKVSDIELCKEYSDNPEKLRAIITDDSFKWKLDSICSLLLYVPTYMGST